MEKFFRDQIQINTGILDTLSNTIDKITRLEKEVIDLKMKLERLKTDLKNNN